ncbi:MAG TPA: hypothetical protein VFX25_36265 [Streptosporangiaceae bacterium]|nr:hypothetical protein [Streptosporangiaceae bacterium]
MSGPAGAAPGAGAYVVRHGWRGFLASVAGLAAWTGIGVLTWRRVRRAGLGQAVRQYAPGVPVVDSPAWPPALSWAEAHRAYPRREA